MVVRVINVRQRHRLSLRRISFYRESLAVLEDETVPFILLVTAVPLSLALIGYFLRGRFGLQISLGLSCLCLCVLLGLLLADAQQPGSTWQGYALIGLLPFLFAIAGMAITNKLSGAKMRALVAFGGIPLLYWLGLLVGVSAAVTMGWASP